MRSSAAQRLPTLLLELPRYANAIRLDLAHSFSMLNTTRVTQTISGCPDAAPKKTVGRPRAAPGQSAQPYINDRGKGGRRPLPRGHALGQRRCPGLHKMRRASVQRIRRHTARKYRWASRNEFRASPVKCRVKETEQNASWHQSSPPGCTGHPRSPCTTVRPHGVCPAQSWTRHAHLLLSSSRSTLGPRPEEDRAR